MRNKTDPIYVLLAVVTRSRSHLQATYTLHGQTLEVVSCAKYLGVEINPMTCHENPISQELQAKPTGPLISLPAMFSQNRLNSIMQRAKNYRSVQRAIPVYDNGRTCVRQSELPRPIKIRPRMYVRRSIMYEKAAFCSPEQNSSVAR